MHTAPSMDKTFSLYLDLVRFLAALAVVLSHYVQHGFLGGLVRAVPGREAVIVFFVLSGFVVAFTTIEKALTLRQYAAARSSRIYSVAIPVVLAAFAAGLWAQQHGASVDSGYQLAKPWLYLPLHFMFMGELWTLTETPPMLNPYWSLGYEVWYYVLFGVAFFLRGRRRLLVGALVLLVMGPKLWLLLPVWLAGVGLYKYLNGRGARPALTRTQARAGWAATILVMAVGKYFSIGVALRMLGIQLWPFPAFPLGSADRYLADYAVCALVCLHFVCARHADFSALQAVRAPVRALAAYTFTLYLVHSLVMRMWGYFYPHDPRSALDIALLTLCIGLATYLFGIVTEKKRDMFRAHCDAMLAVVARRLA